MKGHNETWAEVYKDANKLEIIQQDNNISKKAIAVAAREIESASESV